MEFKDLFKINGEHPKLTNLTLDDIKEYERLVCGKNFDLRGTVLSDLYEVKKDDPDLVYRFLRAPTYEYDAMVTEGRMEEYPNKRVFEVAFYAANELICSMFILGNMTKAEKMSRFDVAGISYYVDATRFTNRSLIMDYYYRRDEAYYVPRYVGLIYLLMLRHDVVRGTFLPTIVNALGSKGRIFKPKPQYNYPI